MIPDEVVPRIVVKFLSNPLTAPEVVFVGVPRTEVAFLPFPEESTQTFVDAL